MRLMDHACSIRKYSDFTPANNLPNDTAFDVLFERILRKLSYFYHSNPHDMGEDAGNRLIQILKEVGTDDEMFPEYEIKKVKQVIESV